jgi:hypothetical protein
MTKHLKNMLKTASRVLRHTARSGKPVIRHTNKTAKRFGNESMRKTVEKLSLQFPELTKKQLKKHYESYYKHMEGGTKNRRSSRRRS